MTKPVTEKLLSLADQVVERATRAGASVAEVVASQGTELSVKVRLGEPELVQEAASKAVGLRVIKDGRVATAYSSDVTPAGIAALVADAIELVELSAADPFAGPPEPTELVRSWPTNLELFDPRAAELDAVQGLALARAGEAAARAHDPRITNSDGGSFSRGASAYALVTSGGFRGGFEGSNVSLVVEPVADDRDGKKQTAAYWDSKRFFTDLRSPETIGVEAAKRCVAKLGAKKVPTAEVPVIFHPDAAGGLLGLLLSCVTGGAIYRRSSYLCNRLGESVADAGITIVDDPLIVRGPASRPFDGEGLASRRNVVVDRGTLATYLLDTYSARKLSLKSTGSAARGTGASPHVSASNFVLQPGTRSPQEIIGEVDAGLYVTHTMGFGFNAVTGDFSRGAVGFWIEKGELTHPVAEVTVSLGFDELWKRIDAVGSDLELRSRVAAPTIRVSRMTVAGG